MKKIYVALVTFALSLTLINFGLSAQADTTKVRCDFYPKGEDKASDYGLCTFSQRQGYISIQKKEKITFAQEILATGKFRSR